MDSNGGHHLHYRELVEEREERREGDRVLRLQIEDLSAKLEALKGSVVALADQVRIGGESVTKMREHTDRRLTVIGGILLAMLAGQHPAIWQRLGEILLKVVG